MGRRRLADRAELAAHLEWARYALHDRHVDVRLILEALIDAIEAAAGMAPDRARPDPTDRETGGVVLS